MKVQFDFKITDKMHTLYNSYLNYPPKGVFYKKSEFKIVNSRNFSFFKKIYQKTRKIFRKLIDPLEGQIIDKLRKDSGFDLIHFANHVGKTNKPCVADYEGVAAFVPQFSEKNRKDALKLLSQKNLKYLLPMNNAALKSFNLFFKNKKFGFKQEVIYPVAKIPSKEINYENKKNIVLFAGSGNILNQDGIYNKGSFEVLIAFENLAKKFPRWDFVFLGKTPFESKINPSKNFIVKDPLPQKELWNLMEKAKIFVQPSYVTPAMAFVEAMHFKLPVVTYDSNSNKDYIDSKNGVLIKPEKTSLFNEFNIGIFTNRVKNEIRNNSAKNSKKIESAISKLIKRGKNTEKRGEESFKKVSFGKFSINKRNEKLLKIYGSALKQNGRT